MRTVGQTIAFCRLSDSQDMARERQTTRNDGLPHLPSWSQIFLGILLLALPATAHVMSMSSGDLTVNGTQAHYELRMPLYEITHVLHPERVFAGAHPL